MKKMIHSLIGTAVVAGSGLLPLWNASAQGTRFYATGGIGPAFTQDTSLREFNGSVVSGSRVKFDTGFQFRAAGGYMITDWLAAEVETGVTYNNIRSITGALESNGDLVNVPFLANLVLQCPKQWRFVPYIGGGLGGSSSVLNADDLVVVDSHGIVQRLHGTDSAGVFAYQGFAGLRYRINDQMGVSLGYRYFGTTAPEWEADLVSSFGSGKVRFGDNNTHSVIAAFTYSF